MSDKRVGYILHNYGWGRFEVEEVDILANWMEENGERFIIRKKGLYVWESVLGATKQSTPGYQPVSIIGRTKKASEGFELTFLRLSLDEVKAEIQASIPENNKEIQDRISRLQDSLVKLNNIDLTTFPKDEYTSPFSGKTV